MRKDVVEDDLSLVDPVDWKVVNGLGGADDEMRDSNGKHEYLELVKHGELDSDLVSVSTTHEKPQVLVDKSLLRRPKF
ncbi:hypothetical protein HDU82_007610 [Entophlyctis luteolus]|nr:hypothetical protein HDU82_007610 [Entophlyctis luteolus]